MILDMRCRILTTSEPEKETSWSLEAFFNELEEVGITTAVSVSGNNPSIPIGQKAIPDRTTPNDFLAEAQRNHPGKFIAVAGIDAGNVFHNALEELERCVKVLGMKAAFIEPGHSPGCALNDPCLYPIYQKCLDLDVAIIPQTSGPFGWNNIDFAHPRYIDAIAQDFPDLRIICGHACYPYVREMIVVAGRRENVYASPDTYLFQLGTEDWVKAVNNDFSFGLSDKFLFASGWIYGNPYYFPLKRIKPYVDQFFKLPWKEEVLEKILYKNALRALKLEDDPVFKEMYKL